MSILGSERISKKEWYRRGGFANPRCWRKQPKNSGWQYYYRHD